MPSNVHLQGSGEITVSATAPVRVYGYHKLDCNACPREDRNESKQVPDILIGGSQSPTTSNETPALTEVSPSPLPSEEKDEQPPDPSSPPINSPRRESPPPVSVVVTPSPIRVQPVPVPVPEPVKESPPPPRKFAPEGGNLFVRRNHFLKMIRIESTIFA